MATASASATEQSYLNLDDISQRITEVFDRVLSAVKTRRDELLAQVDKLKKKFESENVSVLENIRELEEMRAHTEKMYLKQNLAVKKQRESLAEIDSEIDKLKTSLISNSMLRFNYSINQLIEQVKKFGKVIDESCIITKYQSIYSNKLTAVKVITGYRDVNFRGPIKLHLDSDKQLLYVLDSDAKLPIAVFNANDFTFVVEFGEKECSANCMATNKNFIYVGEHTHSILDREGDTTVLKNPTSFCLDEVGNIIITDSATNSIKFFSPEGDLFHKIGEDTVGSDVIEGASNVVTYEFKVFVSCNGSVRVY